MKPKIIILAIAICLTACASMTPTEKKAVGITAMIIVTGAIIANQNQGDGLELGKKHISPPNCAIHGNCN